MESGNSPHQVRVNVMLQNIFKCVFWTERDQVNKKTSDVTHEAWRHQWLVGGHICFRSVYTRVMYNICKHYAYTLKMSIRPIFALEKSRILTLKDRCLLVVTQQCVIVGVIHGHNSVDVACERRVMR